MQIESAIDLHARRRPRLHGKRETHLVPARGQSFQGAREGDRPFAFSHRPEDGLAVKHQDA